MCAMRSRLQIAKADIISYFEQRSENVLWPSDISAALSEQRAFWRLAVSTSTSQFIDFLLKSTPLQKVVLTSDHYGDVTRYVWGKASEYQIALSLKRKSYLSHGSAVFLHGLTNELPTVIYVNQEQSAKQGSSTLSQEGIHRAFRGSQRQSKLVYRYLNYQISVIAGKNTGDLGVTTLDANGERLRVTNVERTLIDIAVRPAYAGGVFQVLEAYKNAKKTVSVNTVGAMLKRIAYIYPYHQVVGFYLERAGYDVLQVQRMRDFGLHYDFYLAHDLRETVYDERWRLFIPKRM